MYDLLQEKGASHIQIFAGGGGTILPEEIKELHAYGISAFTTQTMAEPWAYKNDQRFSKTSRLSHRKGMPMVVWMI